MIRFDGRNVIWFDVISSIDVIKAFNWIGWCQWWWISRPFWGAQIRVLILLDMTPVELRPVLDNVREWVMNSLILFRNRNQPRRRSKYLLISFAEFWLFCYFAIFKCQSSNLTPSKLFKLVETKLNFILYERIKIVFTQSESI